MGQQFAIVKKGYSPEEVDRKIDQLEAELNTYKQREHAIPQAIISAQLTADRILDSAKNEAEQIQIDIKTQLQQMQERIDLTKTQLQSFQEQYNLMISKYIVEFNDKDMSSLYDQLNAVQSLLSDEETLVKEPESFVPPTEEASNVGLTEEELTSLLK